MIFLPRPSGGGGTRSWVSIDTARLDLPTPPPGHVWEAHDTGEWFLFDGPVYLVLARGHRVASGSAWRNRRSIQRAARRILRRVERTANL